MALQREKMKVPPQLFKNIFSLLGYIIAQIFILLTVFQEYFNILRIKSSKVQKITHQYKKIYHYTNAVQQYSASGGFADNKIAKERAQNEA